ncbi:Retrovirus-related Pol polyprotein from transposon RE2 [Bienertia sinuspersici]
MEIALGAKRKLGFITGAIVRDKQDRKLQEQWDTYNNVVINWLHNSMSETIKKSVLYYSTAREIWVQLEKRFTVSNGSTKYRLNKEIYETKQNRLPINEYYTKMCSLWEELENLNEYPAITQLTPEITAYIQEIKRQQEEQHLFQFLNGLDEEYAQQRSQLLLQHPLPSVESACASLQQEESQREIFTESTYSAESSAMWTKFLKADKEKQQALNSGEGYVEKCKVCGRKNHPTRECWYKKGFPEGHPLSKNYLKSGKKQGSTEQQYTKGREPGWSRNRGQRPRQVGGRMNANAAAQEEGNSLAATLTPDIVEKLLKLAETKGEADVEEESDTPFSGMVTCCNVKLLSNDWIIDSGASDHMISDKNMLMNQRELENCPRIRLLNGKTSLVTHTGVDT